MNTNRIIKPVLLITVCLLSLVGWAKSDKVLRIFKGGEVISEYNVTEIDYVEVQDVIASPENVKAALTGNSITVTWGAISGATYNVYRSADNISFIQLAGGLSTTSYVDNSPLKGTNYYRVKAIVGGVESAYSASVSASLPDNGLESGIYLGINGFNQALYRYPVQYLNETSLSGFNGFIDGLTMKNGTILYYSVDEALNTLQSTPLPTDLSTVAVVTFTDGLDQGSLGMTDKYEDKLDYLDAVNKRITSETISGQKLVAYSIGLRGTDVTDNNMFTENLKKLAYPAENAKEVTNISEVNAKFEEIAKTLSESNYVQKVILNCPIVSNGAKIRFTLDNVMTPSKVNSSKLYIEGTFNFKEKILENVVYHGMECISGTKVKGVQDGIFISFTFDGIRTADNMLIKPAYIREWEYVASNSGWQINSEFDTENGADVEVTRSSAAIMLVLDCSSSLGSQFSTVKTSAKNFIKVLYNAVNSGINPTPYPDPNPGSDSDGTIYGHEYVDLGLPSGLKWATMNVGASVLEDAGDYFAWGETSTKTTYTDSNCKTYNKAVDQISGNPEYDAARAKWGSTWRLPSKLEAQELIDKCSWKLGTISGIRVYLVTGPNGKSIYFPATGFRDGSSIYSSSDRGCYWTSSPGSSSQHGYELYIHGSGRGMSDCRRYRGQSVRPVSE